MGSRTDAQGRYVDREGWAFDFRRNPPAYVKSVGGFEAVLETDNDIVWRATLTVFDAEGCEVLRDSETSLFTDDASVEKARARIHRRAMDFMGAKTRGILRANRGAYLHKSRQSGTRHT